jgi:diguanylate cyclase (GGDEF)-like protein
MNPHRTAQKAPADTSAIVRLYGTFLILAIAVGVLLSIVALRTKEIEDWRRNLRSTSFLLTEHTTQTMFSAFLVLDAITERVRQVGVRDETEFRQKLSTVEMHQLLREKIRGLPQLDVATLVAANGDNINFSRAYPAPAINLAERDYFKAHQDRPQLGDHVSTAVRNKGNGRWTFYVSRRIDDAQGRFLGLVLVGLSADAFTGLYGRVVRSLGEGASISLYRGDLTLLARAPHLETLVGRVNETGTTHQIITERGEQDAVELTDSPRFSDGSSGLRLTAVRRTARYPLVVTLVVPESIFLAAWKHTALLIAGTGLLCIGFVLAGIGTISRTSHRREQAEQEIRQLAYYDALTGLPNRRLLLDRLGHAMAASERSHTHHALLLLDLDHFKKLNDTQGHDVGDRLLVEVAQRLQGAVRDTDTVARLGGDEFALLVEELGPDETLAAQQAEQVAEKIHALLNQPYALNDANQDHRSSPSIGMTLLRGKDTSFDGLLKQADVALYQAKDAGRNTIRFFNPAMQAAIDARIAMENALRQALALGQFQLNYQPQVDAHGRCTGAEALIRWIDPVRGLVPPDQFIRLAEETGLIVEIGQWVLDTACRQLAQWATDPLWRTLQLSVNVSARQFHQPDFVERVRRSLTTSGALPTRLTLELTESIVVERVEEVIDRMAQLHLLGVHFSLDDFGTGYSSLSYLKRLPLDEVKIDRSFVRDLVDDSNDAAIVQAILAMSRTLGLRVVAEGVETVAQHEFLLLHGCPVFQGYLFGRPVSIAEWAPGQSRSVARVSPLEA